MESGDLNCSVPPENSTEDQCVHRDGDQCYRTCADLLDAVKIFVTPKYYECVFIFIYVLIFVVGLIGNFLVCFVVWKNHQMRTVTNIFLLNLAASDFMVILICLPPSLLEDVMETWFLGHVMCKVIKFTQRVSVVVSVLTLTAISMERWYAICYPLKFKSTVTRARNIIIAIWIIAMSTSIPDLYYYHTESQFPEITILLTTCSPRGRDFSYNAFVIIVFFVLPVSLMVFAYTKIAICLWSETIPGLPRSETSSYGDDNSHSNTQLQTRRRTARMLIVVMIFFFICYFPVYLLIVLDHFQLLYFINADVVIVCALFMHGLVYLNSATNPLIYNFLSVKFRREFRVAFACCWRLYYWQHRRNTTEADDMTSLKSTTLTKVPADKRKLPMVTFAKTSTAHVL